MSKIITATMDREEAIFALGQGVPVVFYITAVNERYGGDYSRIHEFAGMSKSKVLVTTQDLEFPKYNADGSMAINASPPYNLKNGCLVYDHFLITPGYIDRRINDNHYRTEDEIRANIGRCAGRNSVLASFLDRMRAVETGEQAAIWLSQSIYDFGAVTGLWGDKLSETYKHYASLDSLLKTIPAEE